MLGFALMVGAAQESWSWVVCRIRPLASSCRGVWRAGVCFSPEGLCRAPRVLWVACFGLPNGAVQPLLPSHQHRGLCPALGGDFPTLFHPKAIP